MLGCFLAEPIGVVLTAPAVYPTQTDANGTFNGCRRPLSFQRFVFGSVCGGSSTDLRTLVRRSHQRFHPPSKLQPIKKPMPAPTKSKECGSKAH
jgi:hypothetical protein